MSNNEMPKAYEPGDIEKKWYPLWENRKYFHGTADRNKKPYSIVIPPPNVTGILTLGHVLNNTLQDILCRYHRMKGYEVSWFPGTDHAGIATEARVEKYLRKEENTGRDILGRDEFIRRVWEWKEKYGGTIIKQLRTLGSSCDWEKERFTMDAGLSDAVQKVFIELYNKGYIYRGQRMINWCPVAKSALSDEEVIYRDVPGKFYHFKYPLSDDSGFLVVATTRPETMFGDTAVAVNPEDERYKHLIGKTVDLPLCNRPIPIVGDQHADPTKGSGCVKITPAHDPNDFEVGKRHNLAVINIMNPDASLNDKCPAEFVGLDRFEARELTVKRMDEAGLLIKIEDITHAVGYSERGEVPIETLVSYQWFCNMKELAKPAMEAVSSGKIKFYPERWTKTYFHWMENIQDWCISRQIWWGHRIPAWYNRDNNDEIYVGPGKPDKPGRWEQEEDVLDTWFSSWLWPFSIMGWPEKTADLDYFYPTATLITGPDIIFFWVARMIMAGEEYKQEVPFKKVYFTGIVRDKLGRKMSKSLGNSPDPIELIDKYGADGVRVGMMLTAPAGNDLPFDEALCEQGRNFCNKMWNALRLVKGWKVDENIPQPETAKMAMKWFEQRFYQVLQETNDNLDKYRLSDALMGIYKLVWDDFCSWYLEMVKAPMNQPIDAVTFNATVTFFENLMKILHPFMPFITEDIWHLLKERQDGDDIIIAQQPKQQVVDNDILNQFIFTQDVINNIRKIRAEKNISMKEAIELIVVDKGGSVNKDFDSVIMKLCNVSSINYVTENPQDAFGFLVKAVEFFIPVTDNIDTEAEIKKLEEELTYAQGFLRSVEAKLSNEKFVNGAPAAVVDKERKKKSDAEAKIKVLEQQIATLKK